MDFMSTALVAIKQPTGFWESILSAFKSGTGSYIFAVILIALIIRILFSLVDIINKKVNMKNSDINAKMKPELDAIQKKYGHDQRLLQQKQSEIYKKYQFSMMGSCLPMLLTMVLQFTVFLTLWNSLQSVSDFNIANKYNNIKNIYANVIALNENDDLLAKATLIDFSNGDQLKIEVVDENHMDIYVVNETNGINEVLLDNVKIVEDLSNQDIYNYLNKYVIETKVEKDQEEKEIEVDNPDYNPTYLSESLRTLAEELSKENYTENQESFLWVKNIYKSDSTSSPMFTKSDVKKYMEKYYTTEEKTLEEENDFEGEIFDYIVEYNTQFDAIRKQKNGYYILPIIAMIISFLSTWLNNKLMRNKNQTAQEGQKQGKMMYIIMPIIFGIFTFMYTSLFAIYLIVGQFVMMALTPLTTLIVRKWIAADSKKKKEKDVIEVDYRRKDM